MTGHRLSNTGQRGFTLIEAVMVIVITGIIAAAVAVFIRSPVDGYVDTVTRAELTDAADTALRRMARDVRSALPNSLRTTSAASGSCFEFLPTVGGGRYRVAKGGDGSGDVLDFSAPDMKFDVLASTNLPANGGYSTPHHVGIYNLGIPGADAYNPVDLNRAQIADTATAGGITTITLAGAGNKFPFESPGNRFQVIPDYAVVYSCAGDALRRSTRAISAMPMAACPAAGTVGESVLVAHVDCANSAFEYTSAASQRNGLLTMRLVLTQSAARGDESITLYQEVHVDNTP